MKKTQTFLWRNCLLRFSALILFLCLFLTKSEASHFRSSIVTWTKGTNDTVIFQITQGWRWSAYGNPALGTLTNVGPFTFGDGTSAVNLNLTVNSINSTEDWFVGSTVVKHKYTAAGTSFTAGYNSCCRISTLRDGNNDVSEITNVSVQPYGTNNPPVCLVPPIINLPLNVASTYNLPGFDPEGNTFTYSVTPAGTSGLVTAKPAGLTLSSSGVINWTPTINGLYAMNVTITDQFGATSNIDFILQVSSTSINPPAFDYSTGQTPPNNTVFTVNPGSNISFNIRATDIDPGNTVSLFVTGLPPSGPTFSPALPATGNPTSTTFSWTPTAANVGAHVLAIQASDNTGGQTVTNVVINVPSVAPPVFDVPPTPVAGTGTCVLAGTTYTQVIQAQNSAAGVNTQILSMSGLPTGPTTSPALPTTLAPIATTTLSWTPGTQEWGPNTVTFTAKDANLSTTTHSFNILVNSSPSFTSAMPSSVANVGTLYSHTFSGTDDDLPYGDALSFQTVGMPSWLTLVDNGSINNTAYLSGTPTCAEIGTYTFDVILEDIYHHCGPHIEQTITITVSDNTLPTISCTNPISTPVEAGQCGAHVSYSAPAANDNCTGFSVAQTEGLASGSLFPIGITSNKFVVTDASGLKDSCTFTITVIDTTTPIINCTSPQTVNSVVGICGAMVTYSTPTISQMCGCNYPSIISGYTLLGDFNGHRYFKSTILADWKTAQLNAYALGGHLVTIDDAAENAFLTPLGAGWIGLHDSTSESLFSWVTGSAPSYTNWELGEPNNSGNEDFVEMYSSGKWNDLPASSSLLYVVEFDCLPTLASGIPSGRVFPIGVTPITYQYQTSYGSTASCTFNVTVNDAQSPQFGTPSPELLFYKFDGTGTSVPNLASNPPSGTAIANIIGGATQSGSGLCGSAYAGVGGASSTNYLNTGWAPNVSGDWTISFWAKGNFGTSTLSYMFGDVNSGLRCFTNGVAGANNWLLRGNTINDVLVPGGASLTGSTVTFVYSASSNNIKAYLNGVLVNTVNQGSVNINSVGPLKVGGYSSSTAMVAGTFIDEFRFYSHALDQNEINAIQLPCNYSCPSDIVVNTSTGNCGAQVNWIAPYASDCSPVTMISNHNPGEIFPVGTTTVKYVVTDSYNNSDSCSFNVIVNDTELPTIICPSPIVTCNPIVTYSVTANDNCGVASVNYSIPSGSVFPIGVSNVKVIVTDIHGNQDSCTFQVTVNATSTGSTNASACNTYTWIENGNATYTITGDYTHTFVNSVGCDSIHTLHVTIHNSSLVTNNVSIQGCYTWPASGSVYTVSGTYTANYSDMFGCDSNFILNLTITPGVYVSVKAILAGPYNSSTGLMTDSLRMKGLIPLTEPYSSAPYNKTPIAEANGETVNGNVFDVSGANAIVDWVMIELRSATNSSTIIANKRALIQRDGDVVSTDGVSPVYFATVTNGNYFVSIKHRNHLGVMTPNSIGFSGCATTSYDFRTSPVYTNPALTLAPRKLIGSIYTLWSGDANNNKNVKYNGLSNDKDQVLSIVGSGTPNSTVAPVYRSEDLNLDGKIRYNNTDNDRAIIIENVGPTTQNNIVNQHTPN